MHWTFLPTFTVIPFEKKYITYKLLSTNIVMVVTILSGVVATVGYASIHGDYRLLFLWMIAVLCYVRTYNKRRWVIIFALIVAWIAYCEMWSRSLYHPWDMTPGMKDPYFADKSIAVFTPMYNVNVNKYRKRIEHLTRDFGPRATFYVYGDDSTDPNTLADLRKWASEDSRVVRVPVDTSIKYRHDDRAVRIAMIRNALKAAAVNKPYNFAFVYDADHQGAVHKAGLLQSLKMIDRGEADVVCANGTKCVAGVKLPYDSFALRFDGDASEHVPGLTGLQRKMNQVREVNRLLRVWLYSDNAIIPVRSAFGGGAVYSGNVYIRHDYPVKSTRTCEHVLLHERLRAAGHGRIVINKAFHIFTGWQPSVR
jgi:hypothetical protein